MAFKIVLSDPKTRKAYQKEADEAASGLVGKKLEEAVKGEFLGLTGYELQLTGGSDKEGFPMRPEIPGQVRKKILITCPPGFHPKKEGQRKRKFVCGNEISERIMQVNCKVVEGEGDIGTILGIAPKPPKEKKVEAPKEEMKAG